MGIFSIFNKKSEVNYDFLYKIEGVTLHTALSNDEVNELAKECKEKINFELPGDIKSFFLMTNGLYFNNGTRFFSKYNEEIKEKHPRLSMKSIDVVRYNEDYRVYTDIDEFFILGKDSISYFVYNYSNSKYCVLDNGALDVMNEYECFDIMLKDILTGKIYN